MVNGGHTVCFAYALIAALFVMFSDLRATDKKHAFLVSWCFTCYNYMLSMLFAIVSDNTVLLFLSLRNRFFSHFCMSTYCYTVKIMVLYKIFHRICWPAFKYIGIGKLTRQLSRNPHKMKQVQNL